MGLPDQSSLGYTKGGQTRPPLLKLENTMRQLIAKVYCSESDHVSGWEYLILNIPNELISALIDAREAYHNLNKLCEDAKLGVATNCSIDINVNVNVRANGLMGRYISLDGLLLLRPELKEDLGDDDAIDVDDWGQGYVILDEPIDLDSLGDKTDWVYSPIANISDSEHIQFKTFGKHHDGEYWTTGVALADLSPKP